MDDVRDTGARPSDGLSPATTSRYEHAMSHALALAANGPVTGGNPQVGCLLLDDAGNVIVEGWHRGAGTPHAEVDAISQLRGRRPHTAIVTLEPCNHTGRTGPCALALIDAGVQRVIYAVGDPGASSGGGADRLRAAGVDVIGGVLTAEVARFLEWWLAAQRRGRSWTIVKWASTLDGRAAAADGTSQWITGPEARADGHRLRADADAILTGTGTVRMKVATSRAAGVPCSSGRNSRSLCCRPDRVVGPSDDPRARATLADWET